MCKLRVIGLFTLLLFPTGLMAQITITPTSIFLDQNSRIGNLMVINNSEEVHEITLDFVYGYIESDSNGGITLLMENDEEVKLEHTEHSLAPYIRGFPQNFTLNPGQRQSVRLFVNPPASLMDGTYWTRIVVGSTPATPPVGTTTVSDITANISISLDQNLGLFYKNGDVSTGIEVNEVIPEQMENGVQALIRYSRTGNSPFIGTVHSRLYRGNELVSTSQRSTTLFFDGTYAVQNMVDNLEPGNYRLEVSFTAERNDISPENLVSMSPVSQSVEIAIE